MKTTKITLMMLLGLATMTFAQDKKTFKVPFGGTNKKVMIASGSKQLVVQGHDGNDVIIESTGSDEPMPEEAQGLKLVTGTVSDNTGMGAYAKIEGDLLKIRTPTSKYTSSFKILVPKNVAVSIVENGNNYANWDISNLYGALEAKSSYTTVKIKDVSGPVVAHAAWQNIVLIFDKVNQTKPIAISSNRDIDISLPADTKADLSLKSHWNGDVFTDFDITASNETVTEERTSNASDFDGDVKITEMSVAVKDTSSEGVVSTSTISAKNPTKKEMAAMMKTIATLDKETAMKSKTAREVQRGQAVLGQQQAANQAILARGAIGPASSSSYALEELPSMYGNDDNRSVKGTINGGGVRIKLDSFHGNIFLRKKK